LTEGMKRDIAFNDSWSLEGYRRTSTGADIYVILAGDGTLIDTEGYLKGMVDHVSMRFRFEYERLFNFRAKKESRWV
jgi:hypothetical protein